LLFRATGNFLTGNEKGSIMKTKLSIFMLFLFFLFGCSTTPEEMTETDNENEIGNKALEEYAPNPQVPDDRSLKKFGQTHLDEKGELTLKSLNELNKTYTIGPIELTITEAKVMHLRPDYSLIDYFHTLTHDEEFDFVKVFVEVNNTSEEKLNFAPIAILETSEGEQITWENDIYLEDLNGEIEGNGKKAGNLGFIIENSDIGFIQLTTSGLFDKNEKEISKAETIKINF
jgi:hypothetical protein